MSATVHEDVAARTEAFRDLLRILALEHGELIYYDLNCGSSGIAFVGFTDHSWPKLDEDGRRLQSHVRTVFGELMELVHALLVDLPQDKVKEIRDAQHEISFVIEREGTYAKTADQAFEKASGCLDRVLGQIEDLYDGSGGSPIYVPDTNALIFYPELDRWAFGDEQFTLLLTPLVLSELDALKVEHRNEDVREKADGLISRIKGYRDRGNGDLRSGVTLRTNVSTLRSIAPEPRMDRTLPWLDPTNNDDRLIAAIVEVMRAHVRSPVTLVTRDVNLQNKAAHAAIPFVEPPPPAPS